MNPTVSIIIPTYNRANFLKKSIQSVLSQTIEDFEIIVINNYSTDDTLDVINKFNDSRIKIINFKNDGIIAKSRNKGLMSSSGKYIAFLDDDDLWYPDKLELQIKYLELHPEFDIVYSNAFIIDEKDEIKRQYLNNKHKITGKIFQNLININFILNITVFMKRDVFEKIGQLNEDQSIIGIEDYEYWLRTALKFEFGYIDKPLAMYRIHNTSVSKSKSIALLRQKVMRMFLNDGKVDIKYHVKIIQNIERLNFSASVYYWSVADKINARICAKSYVLYSFKEIRPLNCIFGIILYLCLYFKYDIFKTTIDRFEKRVAKVI